ncbi:alpha-amylase family protein [Cellulomonas sp. KRMCY2]|uniref:alpha-amylase family protein n=1 Tax=Cellulomonas sp. KRMCY2 TaxID=1304865 RepID=UPI00045E6E40|nr:alpha-amylase family protein [Cellulomonas sp. KRMCY2]
MPQNSGTHRPIAVQDSALTLHGEPTAMYGGAVHYWRLERDRWAPILDSVRAMGFTMISIYIPWEVHEISKGRFDFGEINPSNDIDAFLTLCEEKGFSIVVRPGPQINSELTWFGYPKRILANERLHARSAQGSKVILTQVPKPIPALNYASEEFLDETALWFDAICAILAKHAYPHGGIVAAQVDNEMAYFFNVNAYAADYSDESIAGYREFLATKHGGLAGINAAYGTEHADLASVEPPRRFEGTTYTQIPWYADWSEYRERYLITAMDRLAGMMRERGLGGIALFHNYPHPLGPGGAASGFTTPFNLMELEDKLDFVGFDIYARKELYAHVKTVVSYVVGTSRYPYIPEFIAGVWPWYLNPGDLSDEEFVTKAALMHGIRGFSRYMLVERDRWLDSPIRRDGRERADKVGVFGKVNTLLDEAEYLRFGREAEVLLLANREYDRLEATSVLISFPGDFLETPSGFSEYAGALTISEDALGFDQPVQLLKGTWFGAFSAALAGSGYGSVLSDTALRPERWAGRKVVVVSTLDYLDAGLQASLVAFAEAGGTVVMGPKAPTLDSVMRPCTVLADALAGATVSAQGARVAAVGSGRLVLVSELAQVAAVLAEVGEAAGLTRVTVNDPGLDVTVHGAGDDPTAKLVFVANPTAVPIAAVVEVGGRLGAVRELWDGRDVTTDGTAIAETLAPYSIHIYRCTVTA